MSLYGGQNQRYPPWAHRRCGQSQRNHPARRQKQLLYVLEVNLSAAFDQRKRGGGGPTGGLIHVDAGTHREECRRMAERLIELPKGQATLHQRQAEGPNDAANESSGSDA